MFDKEETVFCMVNRGDEISEIIKELEKCQMLCISCHSVITHVENKYRFTGLKVSLKKQLYFGKITKEEYQSETLKYNLVYEEKMKEAYDLLKRKCEEK